MHQLQWSRVSGSEVRPSRGASFVASVSVKLALTDCMPSVVQTSTQDALRSCAQAWARESVGAKAPSSITASMSRANLRSRTSVQVMSSG